MVNIALLNQSLPLTLDFDSDTAFTKTLRNELIFKGYQRINFLNQKVNVFVFRFFKW